jgi:hypothetical protein
MTLPTRELPEPARELIRAMAESARRAHSVNRIVSTEYGRKLGSYPRGMRDAYLVAGRMVRESFGGRP